MLLLLCTASVVAVTAYAAPGYVVSELCQEIAVCLERGPVL